MRLSVRKSTTNLQGTLGQQHRFDQNYEIKAVEVEESQKLQNSVHSKELNRNRPAR